MYAGTYRGQLHVRGKMEFLIFLALVGWGGFKLLKLRVALDGEALRAYIFLEALLNDAPLHMAQEMAARDMAGLSTEAIQQIKREIELVHGGRQTPLIAEAYKWGMKNKLPSWCRAIIEMRRAVPSVFITYTVLLMKRNSQQKIDMAPSKGGAIGISAEVASKDIVSTQIYTDKQGASAEKSFPDITDQERQIADQAIIWCQEQIGAFLESEPQTLPDYGPHHDILVGSYICGFIQGQNIVHRTLDRWSSGDDAVAQVGFLVLAAPAIGRVLGMDRSLEAIRHLPQLGPALNSDDIRLLDQMGGADGMDHARGEPKQNGGMLKHYLVHNIANLLNTY